jgi:carbamoyl-phosphate synthase large subunit
MAPSRPTRLTVLVTAVGAPVAISILKALRQSQLGPRIVATEFNVMSVGLFRADAAYILPNVKTNEVDYLLRLQEICTAERVSMVCFGSEGEMRRVAPHREDIEQATGAKLIVNAPQYLESFMDKWTMVRLLHDKGLPVPDSVLATDAEAVRRFLARHEFPLILKPRHGSGSQNVFVVRHERELDLLSQYVPEPILQEYLVPDAEEYTVGVYRSPRSGYVGQIAFRRELRAGLTYKAEVVQDGEIEAVCRDVVESFDVWGPVNLQLRKTAVGVRIFEINLRFSSSAVIRAYFGFNEPEMCLRDVVLGQSLPRPEIRAGYAFRYWDEIYLEPGEYAAGEAALRHGERRGRKSDEF